MCNSIKAKMTVARTIFYLTAVFALSTAYYIKPGPLVRATKGEVWPKPQKQERADGFLVVRPKHFEFHVTKSTCITLQDALDRYLELIINTTNLDRRIGRITNHIPKQINWTTTPDFGGFLESLDVELTEPCPVSDIPDANMQERYTLNVNMPNHGNKLQSKSIWGILRGLETFSQILYLAETGASDLIVNSTSIKDWPRFHYRGLHLDTARHFQPMFIIKQILDAMAYNKLNVFHWHIVDDQSFPYQSLVFPELSEKGAYHPKYMIYTPEDVQKIIKHAAKRGIRVIPEYDSPGHTRSWGEGRPELLTECYNSKSQPNGYLGPIDPTRNTTYTFLQKFFKEVVDVFPEQYIHLGGDEVDFDCWKSNPNINKWMLKNNMAGDYAMLEDYYIKKLLDIVNDFNATSIVWEEVYANRVQLPKETLVHVWNNNAVLPTATNNGFRTIWSQCWYLDHLSPGGDWKKFYQCDPHTFFHLTPKQEKLIIGGEACMWAEVADATNVVPRIWPRASAVAEKLWSAKNVVNLTEAAKRLEEHACRMNIRGIPAQPPNGAGFCI